MRADRDRDRGSPASEQGPGSRCGGKGRPSGGDPFRPGQPAFQWGGRPGQFPFPISSPEIGLKRALRLGPKAEKGHNGREGSQEPIGRIMPKTATSGCVDLHLHSTCSDGIFAPAEVVRRAADAGLAAMALCDHDNIDGIEEALVEGKSLGVEIISGVELSVLYKSYRDIHLLGYGFDRRDPHLGQALAEFRDFRKNRNRLIVENINRVLKKENRRSISFDRVRELAGGTFGRPHIAQVLIEAGHVRNVEEAFRRYLVPCNVDKRYFPIEEAIALVHRAGGVTSLAHPPYISSDRREIVGILDELVPLGLEGIEAYNTGATGDDIDWYITQARRRGMIVTGGSDFHGIEKGEVQIGRGRGNLSIPYTCVEEIRERLAARKRASAF